MSKWIWYITLIIARACLEITVVHYILSFWYTFPEKLEFINVYRDDSVSGTIWELAQSLKYFFKSRDLRKSLLFLCAKLNSSLDNVAGRLPLQLCLRPPPCHSLWKQEPCDKGRAANHSSVSSALSRAYSMHWIITLLNDLLFLLASSWTCTIKSFGSLSDLFSYSTYSFFSLNTMHHLSHYDCNISYIALIYYKHIIFIIYCIVFRYSWR